MTKYTPWFPGDVAPVRPGVYQTKYPWSEPVFYTKFDGRDWYSSRLSLDDAIATKNIAWGHSNKHRKWRGLAHPAGGKHD